MRIAATIAVAVAAAAQARPLTVTNLGTLAGSNSAGYKVNMGAVAVGASDMYTAQPRGFRWAAGVGMTSLGSTTRAAHNISNTGIIVGVGEVNGLSSAFAWQYGSLTTLSVPGGFMGMTYPNRAAFGVNNAGDVVGDMFGVNGSAGGPGSVGVIWSGAPTGQGWTLWGAGIPLPLTHAAEINAFRVVAGYNGGMAATYNVQTGTYTALGTLGGGASQAHAINNMGRVVGCAQTANGQWQAFIWSPGAGIANLGAAAQLGAFQSVAWDISENNIVVGEFNAGNSPRAFVWNNGVMIDLNTLIGANSGWVLEQAFGIGGTGIIVGKGTYLGEDRGWMINLNQGGGTNSTPVAGGSPTLIRR